MDVKNIHESVEALAPCLKEAIMADKLFVGDMPIQDAADVLKDLVEAEYYARVSKAMKEAKEEDEAQEKYMLRKMKEEYGEDEEGAKRGYDAWRYENGRYAPRGRGHRGYNPITEPGMMSMDMYDKMPENMRNAHMGKMYYSVSESTGTNGSSGGGNSSMGYSEGYERGYSDGQDTHYKRGYSDGYSKGQAESGGHNMSKMENARRGYEEMKKNHPDNTLQNNNLKAKELERLISSVENYLMEVKPDMSAEERAVLKSRVQSLSQKLAV